MDITSFIYLLNENCLLSPLLQPLCLAELPLYLLEHLLQLPLVVIINAELLQNELLELLQIVGLLLHLVLIGIIIDFLQRLELHVFRIREIKLLEIAQVIQREDALLLWVDGTGFAE